MEESERKKQRLAALEKRERSLAGGAKHGCTAGPPSIKSGGARTQQASPSTAIRTVARQPLPTASTVTGKPRESANSYQQPQGGESVYSEIPDHLFDAQEECTTNASRPLLDASVFVDDFVRALLGSNSKVHDAGAALDNRLNNRTILLDNPGGGAGGRRVERARRRQLLEQSRRFPKHFSNRQHKARGSYRIPASLQRYELYAPLHDLWKAYIKGLLSETSSASISNRLLSADLHGAFITVVRAKDPSTVGWSGVVVKETLMAFSVITMQDSLRLLLKKGTIFTVDVEDLRVTLHGNALVDTRAACSAPSSKAFTTIEL